MLGPLVNALVVVVCSLVGCFLVKKIPQRIEDHIKKAIGLVIIFVGIKGALENQDMLLLIMSMVIGAVIGELIDIDKWMNRLGQWAERKLGMEQIETSAEPLAPEENRGQNRIIRKFQFLNNFLVKKRIFTALRRENAVLEKPPTVLASKSNFSKGFVSASILFCSGSMAIVGSMQSGLQGNHDILYAKSILDGSISLVFGASMGIGVAFSALLVLAYQGGIALASQAISGYLTPEIIREMSAVGSIIIAGIGFNFLGTKEIKVANLIPAVFIPWFWLTIGSLWH